MGTSTMKVLVFLLAAIVASVSGQEAYCRCAAFTTHEHSELRVYEGPTLPVTSCDTDHDLCKDSCYDYLDELTDGGDLWRIQQDGQTVGQHICSYMASHFIFFIHNKMAYGYYEFCGGAWEYSGVASQQKLCCNGGRHDHCIT